MGVYFIRRRVHAFVVLTFLIKTSLQVAVERPVHPLSRPYPPVRLFPPGVAVG